MGVISAVLVVTIAESSAQTIYGCVSNKNGALRIVASPNQCTESEKVMYRISQNLPVCIVNLNMSEVSRDRSINGESHSKYLPKYQYLCFFVGKWNNYSIGP